MKKLSEINRNYPWWSDCISQVIAQIVADKTCTSDNMRDKAENYTRNFLATAVSESLDREGIVKDVVDQVEKKLKHHIFDTRPNASVIAQEKRKNIPERPEDKFIKLR